jgi:hypothetical protein
MNDSLDTAFNTPSLHFMLNDYLSVLKIGTSHKTSILPTVKT